MPLSGAAKLLYLIKKPVQKVKNYLRENKRINTMAGAEMDKRYPAGWAQNATHMMELNKIKKNLKK